jgi:hypothetical protein
VAVRRWGGPDERIVDIRRPSGQKELFFRTLGVHGTGLSFRRSKKLILARGLI